jgi:hypothetical protein
MKKRLILAAILILVLVTSLVGASPVSAANGSYSALFAGTSDPAMVYMYSGSGTTWIDISGSSLSGELAVLDIVQYQGQLYAATMDYTNDGKVWRYEGGTTWTSVFTAPSGEYQVASLAVYDDMLYAGTVGNGGNLYCYNTATETFDYVGTMPDTDSAAHYHPWYGIRSMYVWPGTGDLHLGDHGYDCLGRFDGTSLIYDAYMSGSCIYDFEAYDSMLYAGAWSSRLLWSATGTGYPWSYEEPISGYAHIWELEEYQGDLYMGYDDGILATYNGYTLGATTVLTADDGIISMTTDGALLYYGIGGEAGYGYDSGVGYVYSYDGSSETLISGAMGDGVQVLYIGNPGLVTDKVLVDAYDIDTEGDDILDLNEKWYFEMEITVTNVSPLPVTDVMVKDNLGGDLELYSVTGDPEIRETGKTEKVHLTWDEIGTLAPGASVTLTLIVATDTNTGTGNSKKDGHQEYTSEGEHCLNSGATAKGIVTLNDIEYEVSYTSDEICVETGTDPM